MGDETAAGSGHQHDLSVLSPAASRAAAESLRMLGDATRLSILWQLRSGELTVAELAQRVGRPQTAVSQHLAKLRMARLVATRRDGTHIHYRLATDHVLRLVEDAVRHTQHLDELPHHLEVAP